VGSDAECKKVYNASEAGHASAKRYRKSVKGQAVARRSMERFKERPDWSERLFRYNLKSRYGISVEQYQALFEAQGGRCGNSHCGFVYQEGGPRLRVDHDHRTKVVRGLVCHQCNTALGLTKDSIAILLGLAAYLKERGYE
jgi:hypothetical protein